MRNWTKLYFQYGHRGGHIWNQIQKLNANFGVLIGGNMCAKIHICMSNSSGEEDVYGRRMTTKDNGQAGHDICPLDLRSRWAKNLISSVFNK